MYCKQKDIAYQYSSEPKRCICFVLRVVFVWVWNLVADTEGGTKAEGAEENICD